MKKTLNITIGGRVFAIEDDAYERLSAYLAEMRTVFANYPDADEIVADMEDRMADQFESQGNTKDRCITLSNIETLVATMGSADDLRRTVAGEEPSHEEHRQEGAQSKENPRKLYRNPDDKIILGVCSGIAAYFGIDTVFVRLAFIAFTLLGGSGIILYIILAIIMPEAKTMTEKMAMRGEPITLAGVVEQVKSEFTEEKNEARIAAMKRAVDTTSQKLFHQDPKSVGNGFMRALERIVNFFVEIVRRFFQVIVPVGVRIIGIPVLLFGIALFCAPIVFGTFILANNATVLGPWGTIVSTGIVAFITLLGIAAAIIPATLFILLGVSLLRYKNSFPGRLTGALIIMWIIVMITGVSIIVSNVPRWSGSYELQYAQASVNHPVTGSFKNVSVDDNYYHRVKIVGGPTTSIRLTGDRYGIDQTDLTIRQNELHISKKPQGRWRLFGGMNEPEIIITVPAIDQVTMNAHSTVEITNMRQPKLKILAYSGRISAHDNQIDSYEIAQQSFSEVRIENGTTTIKAELRSGNAQLVTLGATLVDPDIKLSDGASVHLGVVTGTLFVAANSGSRLYYLGTPKVEANISQETEVRPYPKSLWNDEDREHYYGQEYLND